MHNVTESSKTLVFFDGGCPLCRREIAHYQRLAQSHRFEWIDICHDMNLLQAFGVSFETAMERLHVLHQDGRLLTGAYAFSAIWSELPGYRLIAKTLQTLPGSLKLLDAFYNSFARWRFRRRCTDGVCSTI